MGQAAEIVARNEYGTYSVPAGLMNRPAVRMVTAGDVYEPKTIRFMCENAGDGDIVHAGAFFGDFLPALSRAVKPGRKVWAFEPNPDNFGHARRTLQLNGLSNVELHNAAVSDRDGALFFKLRDHKGRRMGGHSHVVDAAGEGVAKVPAQRIDDIVPEDRKVSILQLDVEGHETEAMLGAMRVIRDSRPILVLEGFRRFRWVKLNLAAFGYRLVGRIHVNRVFAPFDLEIG